MIKKIHFLCLFAMTLLAGHFANAQNLNLDLVSTMDFPGQTLANVCGYAQDGREYALLGGSQGLIIVDVTQASNPVNLIQIPGPNSLWKEIKTFKNYAYVVTEGGEGIQIVDLKKLPLTSLDYHHYKGDGEILNQLNSIHALHIDETKGYLYAFGSNLFGGGAVVVDLNGDPYNPKYVGKFEELGYIHDGYVDNDTLYAGHIYMGAFSIVDMKIKNAPAVLGTQITPGAFTHNTWLSADRKTIFTTDEVNGSYVAAYDISDPTDIKFLDKVQSNPGSGSIAHNTHIKNNYAFTSWYKDGVTIIDVTNPQNLVQVGNFDTYPTDGGGFEGCWGVYPYLPSGLVIATNIEPGQMFVLKPIFTRACYLEGVVVDATTGDLINGAKIEIVGGSANATELSEANGAFKTGQTQEGEFTIKVTKFGYEEFTETVTLLSGESIFVTAKMQPSVTFSISGTATDAISGAGVPNAKVALINDGSIFEAQADATGTFTIPGVFGGTYELVAGAWGYQYGVIQNQVIGQDESFAVTLDKGYRDDFIFDYGWNVGGTSSTGIWERAKPLGINVGILLSPDADIDGDYGNTCYVTGNSSSEPGIDDVESGTSILTSPVMDLSTYNDPSLKAMIWCTSISQSQQFQDSVKIFINNGLEEKLFLALPGNVLDWQIVNKKIKPVIALTNNMTVKVVGYDNPIYIDLDSYEAAIDFFRITDTPVSGTDELAEQVKLSAWPNPFAQNAVLEYELPENGYAIAVYDIAGKQVNRYVLTEKSGNINFGSQLEAGVYFANLSKGNVTVKTVKLVKTK